MWRNLGKATRSALKPLLWLQGVLRGRGETVSAENACLVRSPIYGVRSRASTTWL